MKDPPDQSVNRARMVSIGNAASLVLGSSAQPYAYVMQQCV